MAIAPPTIAVLLLNCVREFPLKDKENSNERNIAPPYFLAVLFVNSVLEFPLKDKDITFLKYIAPPTPTAAALLKNFVME